MLEAAQFRFMLVTDSRLSRRPLLEAVEAALDAGFTAVQLREREMSANELYLLACDLRALTRRRDALLLINDRIDVALAVDADGAHLGWKSINPHAARYISDGRLAIGVSAHSIRDVRAALKSHSDYVILGPVFPTPSKEGLVDPLGIEKLRQAAVPTPIPVVGIGGINTDNVGDVFAARACGVAVIRAVLDSNEPHTAARSLVDAAERYPTPVLRRT